MCAAIFVLLPGKRQIHRLIGHVRFKLDLSVNQTRGIEARNLFFFTHQLRRGEVNLVKFLAFSPVILHPLHRSSVIEAPLEGELGEMCLVHFAFRFR